jgi:hypothetical protein
LLAHLLPGLISATDRIAPLVSSTKPQLQRHFSAFPLSSHLHAPSIKLVSLHSLLQVKLSCSRIPDIEDGLELEWFLARTTTADELVTSIVETLGFAKVISGPGGGTVDYVLEEAWVTPDGEESKLLNLLRVY